MVRRRDRTKFLGRLGQSEAEPISPVTPEDIARLASSEELSFDDVKTLMRGIRYGNGYDEKFDYANSLVPEASCFLRPYELRALARADMSEKEAAAFVERDKAFYHRLTTLLHPVLRLFGEEALRNPQGIVGAIDDLHNDFRYALSSPRRDRQIREAKERLKRAARLAREAATAIEEAEEHFKHEYNRYRDVYYLPAPGPNRFVGDLIDELQMCAGVMDITYATADIKPKRLFLFGSDQRTSVVEDVYHMCSMYDGPKLVTTPGSDFATLCSLVFELVSAKSDEGLAGAINRYARSPERKQWDKEGEDDDPDDNFHNEKNQMYASSHAIELCRQILQTPDLSEKATALLSLRIKHEERQHEAARNQYGPRQVYVSQMNKEQWDNMLLEAFTRLKPQQQADIDDMIMKGKSMADSDMERGQRIRAERQKEIDAKSGDKGS